MTSTSSPSRRAAVVVAHPDDEVLWCGGLILKFPSWKWHVISVCRGSDPDRSPRFIESLKHLNAVGQMADLDDGPAQYRLDKLTLKKTIAGMLGKETWDLVVTHGPRGEYTRHRRHEEVCEAVVQLWESEEIPCKELWMFAYGDQEGSGFPLANEDAPNQLNLDSEMWAEKHRLIMETYGFSLDSWEARTTPRREAFFTFDQPDEARAYVNDHAPD